MFSLKWKLSRHTGTCHVLFELAPNLLNLFSGRSRQGFTRGKWATLRNPSPTQLAKRAHEYFNLQTAWSLWQILFCSYLKQRNKIVEIFKIFYSEIAPTCNATLLHRITSKSNFRLKFCHAQKLAFLDTLGSRYQINF